MKNKLVITHKEVNVTPITLFINIYGWTDKWLAKHAGIPHFGKTASIVRDYNLDFYTQYTAKYLKAHKSISRKIIKGQLPINVSIKNSLKIGGEIKRLISSESKILHRRSDKEIAKLFKKVFKLSSKLCSFGFIGVLADWPEEFISPLMDKILQEKLEGRKFSEISQIKLLLSSSTEKRPLVLSREEFLKTMSRKQNLNKWLKKWAWINFGHMGELLSESNFTKEINEFLENPQKAKDQLKEIRLEYKSISKNHRKLFGQLRLSKSEMKIFEYAQQIAFIKGYRTDILALVYAFFDQIFEFYSKKLGVDKEVFRYSSREEILNYILGVKKVHDKKILERKKYSIWIFNTKNKKTEILDGEKAKKFEEKFISRIEIEQNMDVISGSAAFLGKVTGKVKIVNDTTQLDKVKEGDVLVSIQTTPELLPAMKRASAFVTEVGGITSHAAIVAREMRKPCIVGTKIAAQILRDNDLIQVDANHGLVRILQRA